MFKSKAKKQKEEIELHDKPYLDKPIILERKKFEYRILFTNGEIETGECSVDCIDDLVEMFLNNKYTKCNNDRKIIFYNIDTISAFEAREIEKGE